MLRKKYGSKCCEKNMEVNISKGCEKNKVKILRKVTKKKKKIREKAKICQHFHKNRESFLQKGKRKDQKDQFLIYNMSLFLKEENGRLALHYILCESTTIR